MIKKAIIPAAGLGTRFLPVTKSMPKNGLSKTILTRLLNLKVISLRMGRMNY